MSNTKTVMSQAANTQGIPLDITDVFSTYLYTGNSASQPINNGVDLSGEGGMVWLKARTAAYNNIIVDSERGSSNGTAYNPLFTNLTNAENTAAGYGVTSFDSNGFTLGPSGQQAISNQGGASYGDIDYASWTFRKAPKFFDVVTYTGDGNSSQTIPHNLGGEVGFIVVKKTSASGSWFGLHRDSGLIILNETGATYSDSVTDGYFGDGTQVIRPTSTHFTIGSAGGLNDSGVTLVAYLFAHNDGDGEFGPDGDQDIIKCGSYTGNGSSNGPEIDLGFEPQWVLIKEVDATGNWQLFDSMRGMVTDGSDARIAPNLSSAEDSIQSLTPTATGFKINTTSGNINTNNSNHIYMAIRRGPLAQPESGTEVFAPNFYGTNGYVGYLGAPADMHMLGYRSGNSQNAIVSSRMIQGNKALVTSSTAAEITTSSSWDNMSGVTPVGTTLTTLISWTFKRAPGFFDVVAYTGDGVAGRTVSHNLGVAPEMMWVKKRNVSEGWQVYHSALTATDFMELNQVFAASSSTGRWNNTEPTATDFTLGSITHTNASSDTYIAYLFATLPGISKVGSYTGNGTSQTIDCGFTSGARFVLSKCVSHTGAWYVFDTERGIVSGNDRVLELDSSNPEVIYPGIDPQSSGFIVNDNITNESGRTFIFYAIA